MENIITKSCEQFGIIRQIKENPPLWCGSDVAKALGYKNTRKALIDHCKGVTKRDTPTKGGIQKISFIPEADVYRLICHSKLPKAQEFEKWVFEDVVPKAVHGDNYEQDYEYFDKTYRGQPVLSVCDISELMGIKRTTLDWYIRTKGFIKGKDYYRLEAKTLSEFKAENPRISKLVNCMNVVTKSGFNKLAKILGIKVENPTCFLETKSNLFLDKMPTKEFGDNQIKLFKRICKDNGINVAPLTQELRNVFGLYDQSEPSYTVRVEDGPYHILYDNSDLFNSIEKQYLIATGIAQIMCGRLDGKRRKEVVDIFAAVLTALSLFAQYNSND